MPKIIRKEDLEPFVKTWHLEEQGEKQGLWKVKCIVCEKEHNEQITSSDWKNKKIRACGCQGVTAPEPKPKRPRIFLTYGGETLSIPQWSVRLGIPEISLRTRLKTQRSTGDVRNDEWVIFGNRARDDKSVALPVINSMVSGIRSDIIEGVRPILLQSLEAAVDAALKNTVYPFLAARIKSEVAPLPETTPEPVQAAKEVVKESIKEAVKNKQLPAARCTEFNPAFYDPAPRPDDDIQMFENCTIRQYREDMGDDELKEAIDKTFEVIRAEYAARTDSHLYEFRADELRRQRQQDEEKEEREREELRRTAKERADAHDAKVKAEEQAKLLKIQEDAKAGLCLLPLHKSFSEKPIYDKIPILPKAELLGSFPQWGHLLPQAETKPMEQADIDWMQSAPWWESFYVKESLANLPGRAIKSQFDRYHAYLLNKDKPGDPDRKVFKQVHHVLGLNSSAHAWRMGVDPVTTNFMIDHALIHFWMQRKQKEEDVLKLAERYAAWHDRLCGHPAVNNRSYPLPKLVDPLILYSMYLRQNEALQDELIRLLPMYDIRKRKSD